MEAITSSVFTALVIVQETYKEFFHLLSLISFLMPLHVDGIHKASKKVQSNDTFHFSFVLEEALGEDNFDKA